MTLREFLKHLRTIVEKDKRILDYEVVYSSDEEGNGFQYVFYGASVGHYDSKEREFRGVQNLEEDKQESVAGGYDQEDKPLNAVCIN